MKALQQENLQSVIRKRDMNIESILLKVAKRQDDFNTLQNQRNAFKAKQIENYRAQGKREQDTAATLYRLKSETKPERIQGCLNRLGGTLGLNVSYDGLVKQFQAQYQKLGDTKKSDD